MRKLLACFVFVALLFALTAPIGLSEMSGIGLSVDDWNNYLTFLLEAKDVDIDIVPIETEYDDPTFEVKITFHDGYEYSAYMAIYPDSDGMVSTALFSCELFDAERSDYDDPINVIWATAIYIAGMYNDEDADTRDRMFAGVRYFLEDMKTGSGADKLTIENGNHSFSIWYRRVTEAGYPDFLGISIY